MQRQNSRLEAASQHHCNAKTQNSKPASQYHFSAQAQSLKPASQTRRSRRASNTTSMRKHRVGGSRFNTTATPKTWSSKPATSVTSTDKHRAQARIPTGEEPYISVLTTPITRLSAAHVMRGVNSHHGGFLKDSFTPETPINSSVCY